MAFTFVNVYFHMLGTNRIAPPTCATDVSCGPNSRPCGPDTGGPMMVEEVLRQASKHELEELRELLATLQRQIEPHVEAAGKEPRPPKQWEDPDSREKR